MIKKIQLTKKSLKELTADVLFCYTNTDLLPPSSGTMKDLMEEYQLLIKDSGVGTLKRPGMATLLSGEKVGYKKICYLAISGLSNDPSEMSIRESFRWGFQLLSEDLYPTYIIPSLYEEAQGMPSDLCAEIVMREISTFAESKFVEKITVQCRDGKQYSSFLKALKKFNE
jgi:hypothetical protein